MLAAGTPKESACNYASGSTQLAKLRGLIADDGFAATFQTMGRYRTALLQVASAIERSPVSNVEPVVTDHSVDANKMVQQQATPRADELGMLGELTWCIEHGCHGPRTYRALVKVREQFLAAESRQQAGIALPKGWRIRVYDDEGFTWIVLTKYDDDGKADDISVLHTKAGNNNAKAWYAFKQALAGTTQQEGAR